MLYRSCTRCEPSGTEDRGRSHARLCPGSTLLHSPGDMHSLTSGSRPADRDKRIEPDRMDGAVRVTLECLGKERWASIYIIVRPIVAHTFILARKAAGDTEQHCLQHLALRFAEPFSVYF